MRKVIPFRESLTSFYHKARLWGHRNLFRTKKMEFMMSNQLFINDPSIQINLTLLLDSFLTLSNTDRVVCKKINRNEIITRKSIAKDTRYKASNCWNFVKKSKWIRSDSAK